MKIRWKFGKKFKDSLIWVLSGFLRDEKLFFDRIYNDQTVNWRTAFFIYIGFSVSLCAELLRVGSLLTIYKILHYIIFIRTGCL